MTNIVTALALLITSFCLGQIPENVKKEVDNRVASGKNPSIVVGVFKEGKADYYVAGVQNLETKQPATTASIYEIGSVTKTFTALLFAKMALENKVTLDTEIRTLFPAELKLVSMDSTAINFRHLATHTSGLHSYPMGYEAADSRNPYVDLDKEKVYKYLTVWGSQKTGDFSYSNIGAGLMGEGLAIIEDKPYTSLIQSEILNTLNLSNTFFTVPAEKLANFTDGYEKGIATAHWDFDILAPAGALKSDIKDLLNYGISYLQDNPLSKAQALTTQQQFQDKDGKTKLGINWFITDNVISHGGGTYGFSTHLSINLEKKEVIAIMTNTGDQNIGDIASYLMDPQNNRLYTEEDVTVEVPLAILKSYEGVYENSQYGLEITVIIKDNKLFSNVKGQSEFLFNPVSTTEFINAKLKAQLTFEKTNGEIKGFTLHQAGQKIVLKKQ